MIWLDDKEEGKVAKKYKQSDTIEDSNLDNIEKEIQAALKKGRLSDKKQ